MQRCWQAGPDRPYGKGMLQSTAMGSDKAK
jgi:hypothetical protein